MKLLKIEDVAALLSMSPATVTHWAYRRRPAPEGFPEAIRIGRMLRWPDVQIDAWIARMAGLESEPAKSAELAVRRGPGRLRNCAATARRA